MEIARDGVDSDSPSGTLSVDIPSVERRVRKLDDQVAALRVRVARMEACTDHLRSDIKDSRERQLAERASFRERACAFIALGLIFAAGWAKALGWI